jgi:cyclopropane-fatty-acyl-phospholipid synthase
MWDKALDAMLARLITYGTLTVRFPDGTTRQYGEDHSQDGPIDPVCIQLTDDTLARELCLRPVLALGEGYMNGTLIVDQDRLFDFLTLLVRNQNAGNMPAWHNGLTRVRAGLRKWMQRNDPRRAHRNVAHHYDISDTLYALFLDPDMQYSCAYFGDPEMTLQEAQAAKKAHIAAKLCLSRGQRVLDIGCGWGGMALTLARDHGVHVTGLTLSRNQHATAQRRAQEAGLQDQTDFRLQDYRQVTDRFDRIVSVGMLEHVGLPQYPSYFGKIHDLLAPDGVALIHTIGRVAPPLPTSPWLEKYIFPGGYVPSLSDLAAPMERADLWLADIEVLRGHYGPTLNHWRQRFEANLETVRQMYDERFIRMWRFYLVACEMAFEEQHQAVFQIQLSHRQHVVPATRDYLYRPQQHSAAHAAQ